MVSLRSSHAAMTLHGRRIQLRTLGESDYEGWVDVRQRCRDWLLKWEPRSLHAAHLA
jgi:tRNA-dihydrouridine synthase